MSRVVAAWASAPPRSTLAGLLGASPLSSQCRADYREAVAELVVGDILDNLGPRWDVLHDVPLEGHDLDHLVLGPTGVFAVRSADYGDREALLDGDLFIAGVRTDDVGSVARQADDVARRLTVAGGGHPVAVTPLLVIVAPRRLTTISRHSTVEVVTAERLARHLASRSATLAGPEVALLSDLADRETTWPEPTGETSDRRHLHRAFAQVRAHVRAAARRRTILSLTAGLVLCVGVWAVVAFTVSSAIAP
ncbi:hypothetical protein M2152_000835 [Microbacteriaceae bacterium SG_E_30_P1]|uniref:NERD domain-containing protein n=1 Tax=Antiquaquibacter oligotrophicus TaxID=2880260 RepID=A0ABT6KMJ4_9MICO|nr:nuclease-related domain-containing protein [Antiquaquibacter oligotrophicus]MDH6180653.1 hypothetical protein [Antiquaquibacter oligotrophicus]UDF13619.1 NERD domain-containing protein [Antiquaquibacter oligotrophicus]